MIKVTLLGRVGSDPVLRTTKTGKTVANFSVADNQKEAGEQKTRGTASHAGMPRQKLPRRSSVRATWSMSKASLRSHRGPTSRAQHATKFRFRAASSRSRSRRRTALRRKLSGRPSLLISTTTSTFRSRVIMPWSRL